MKVLIIINYIGPIRVFLFNKLKKYFDEKNCEFKVIFLSETDKNRDWRKEENMKFNFEILNNFAVRTYEKDLNTFFINPKIIGVLNKENPDKIISFGWDHFACYAANHWCRKNNKKFTLWSGSTIYEKSWRRTLFNPLVKWLVKRSNNFIAYGTRSKEYLISLGAPENKVQIFFNTIDVEYFEENISKITEEQKADLKKELGITTSKIILFSGRLIEMKGIFEMLEGYADYKKIDNDISLLIMGKGPDETNLKKYISENKIKDVFFTGFIQYNDLYKYYAISELFLFPSRQDIWGQVINEAVTCNLPIITTEKVGACADLVEEGKNGYIIKENCAKCITGSILKIFKNNLHKSNSSKEILEKIRIENILKNINLL
jgi:glycosyltransferase involved in cell wall biosynthesis